MRYRREMRMLGFDVLLCCSIVPGWQQRLAGLRFVASLLFPRGCATTLSLQHNPVRHGTFLPVVPEEVVHMMLITKSEF